MARPAVVIALPLDEERPVVAELRDAGFDAIAIHRPEELQAILESRRDVAVAILDGERDFDTSLEYYELLREGGRAIPALMVLSPRALDRMSVGPTSTVEDEFFARPYSAESLRWRVEAMCIRSVTIDDGSGPVIQSQTPIEIGDWQRRATVVAVFNPKGGVGKTTIATNLAAALQLHRGQRVLLVDADTVTGHVTTSLGLEQVRTVADSWRDHAEGGPSETLLELAAPHTSGMSVVALTSSPLNTEILDPERVADAIAASRRGFDFIVVDLHPSYSPLNQAIFQKADRILVPVTPDVPALRAAVMLRDVAIELGIADRLALIVNRANSGVSVADMERTVGMTALALIRSGGLLFVKAANEGRTVIEMYPKERITEDFDALAECLLGTTTPAEAVPTVTTAKPVFRLFGRAKDAARA
ncbi:MAG TPA: AAA family ATPase [Candidatus Limnocylindrales bacterium]|nr:AAA family ATPase [Candidatus Limnocylindrales bacterium]